MYFSEMSLEFAIEIAKTAGKIIQDGFNKHKTINTKSSVADLVTETDQYVEKVVHEAITAKYPDHKFIGEESAVEGAKITFTDDPTWIIDPVDGTSNFVHRFPFCCISIGFAVNKEVEFGVVYNPILDDLFYAEKGKGAFKNGQRIHVSDATTLLTSLICTEFGGARDDTMITKISNMDKVVRASRGIRSLGSAAMNMCMVAQGAAEAFYEYGIHCWDIAAGDLIVREAGGFTSHPNGGPFDLMSRTVLCACSPQVAAELTSHLTHIPMKSD